MKLVFATHNQNKLIEVAKLLPAGLELVSLTDIGCHEEIPETGATLEENALIKANHVHQHYGLDCFADDTGLLVDALNGAPGVYSARYAGEGKNTEDNMDKLLRELEGKSDREAQFKTVIALKWQGETFCFEGAVAGTILPQRHGTEGFGYDPLFLPHGHDRSFAQMSMTEKNKISHRGRAMEKLINFLTQRI